MPQVRVITPKDPLYPRECDLRERVLLRPIGFDIERYLREYPDNDERSEHFVLVEQTPGGSRVLACGLVLPPAELGTPGKLTQMAVDPQRQGEGLGRILLASIESRAFGQLRLPGLYCHAQVRAIGFYEKMGWLVEGEQFMEAGIWHRKMTLAAPREPSPVPSPTEW